MARITHQTLLNAKPKAKPHRITIGGGRYLLIKPNGSKLWRYDYKVGTRKTLCHGRVPYRPAGAVHRRA